MDIKKAYNIYNKVAALDRVKRSVENISKMMIENSLSSNDSIRFSKDVTLKDGTCYPITINLTLGDVINALRMLEETLTIEVEDL